MRQLPWWGDSDKVRQMKPLLGAFLEQYYQTSSSKFAWPSEKPSVFVYRPSLDNWIFWATNFTSISQVCALVLLWKILFSISLFPPVFPILPFPPFLLSSLFIFSPKVTNCPGGGGYFGNVCRCYYDLVYFIDSIVLKVDCKILKKSGTKFSFYIHPLFPVGEND